MYRASSFRLSTELAAPEGVGSTPGGAMPVAKMKPVDKAEAKVAETFQAMDKAGGGNGDGKIDADTFVAKQVEIKGDAAKDAAGKAFKAYAGDDAEMNDAEFANFVRDQAGGKGSADLADPANFTAVEAKALNEGIKAPSADTKAKQEAFNTWLGAQDKATQDRLAAQGVTKLNPDSKEGPLTRAALRAKSEFESQTRAAGTIAGSKIEPGVDPFASAEDQACALEADKATLDAATKALDSLPADFPGRADAEAKVKALGDAFQAKSAPPPAPAPPPPAGGEAPPPAPAQTLPDGVNTLAAAESVEEKGEGLAQIAKERPDAIQDTAAATLDDNGVRAFMGKLASDPGGRAATLDKLHPQARAEMMRQIDGGTFSYVTDGESGFQGELAASLARTNPEVLTPEMADMLDDDGVRAFMENGGGGHLKGISRATKERMAEVMDSGWTTDTEQQYINLLQASIRHH